MFYFAAVIALVAMLATFGLVFLRRRKTGPGERLRIRETWMTIVLGIALWAEVLVLAYCGHFYPERLFTNRNALINTCIFLLLGALLGSAAFLYYFVKCVIIYQDGFCLIDLLGNAKSMKWEQVTGISKAAGKRLKLTDSGGRSIQVGGSVESFDKFLQIAKKELPPQLDRNILSGLEKAGGNTRL